jgi:hypothetical protein
MFSDELGIPFLLSIERDTKPFSENNPSGFDQIRQISLKNA